MVRRGDERGYIWISACVEFFFAPRGRGNVINVSRHRLSTADIKSALVVHNGVVGTAGEFTLLFLLPRPLLSFVDGI